MPPENQKLLFKGQLKDKQTLQVGAGPAAAAAAAAVTALTAALAAACSTLT